MKIKFPLYLTKNNTIVNIASIVSIEKIFPLSSGHDIEYRSKYNHFYGYNIITYIKFIGFENSVKVSLITSKELENIMTECNLTFESQLTDDQHKLIEQKTMEIAQKEFDFIVEKWHEFVVS